MFILKYSLIIIICSPEIFHFNLKSTFPQRRHSLSSFRYIQRLPQPIRACKTKCIHMPINQKHGKYETNENYILLICGFNNRGMRDEGCRDFGRSCWDRYAASCNMILNQFHPIQRTPFLVRLLVVLTFMLVWLSIKMW